MIRSITRKLDESREVLGLRCFVGEVIGVPVAIVAVWAIAGFAVTALSPSGSSPQAVSPASPLQSTIAGEN